MFALNRAMLVWVVLLLPGCLPPIGDPLVGLDAFVEDLFRFQIDPIDVALLRSDSDKANQPPEDINERQAIHLSDSFQPGRSVLTCADVVLQGYDDWATGNAAARTARENAVGNESTAEMRWPNFWNWYSPVLVVPQKRIALLGTLFSATYEIALLKSEANPLAAIEPETGHLSALALEQVLTVPGRGYQSLYANRLASMSFSIENIRECATTTIFTLRIQ